MRVSSCFYSLFDAMNSPLSWFDRGGIQFDAPGAVNAQFTGFVLAVAILRLIGMWIQKRHKDLARVPGYPIVGNLVLFLHSETLFFNITDLVLKYGPLLELWVFNQRVVVVADTTLARECLMRRPKSFRRTSAMKTASLALGFNEKRGVFFAEGEAWSRQRRLTSPAFSHKNVELMASSISEELDSFILRLKGLEAGEVIQMDKQLFSYTIRVISAVAFCTLPERAHNYFFGSDVIDDVHDLFAFMLHRTLFRLPEWMWRLSPQYAKEINGRKANSRFTSFSEEVVKNARVAFESDGEASDGRIGRKSLIESLLGTKEGSDVPMTDEEIVANVKIFFLAGSDTTSVAITWCLYQLCIDEALQREVQREVDSVLGENMTGADAVAAVPLLPLCTALFKETLRLRGPVDDIALEVSGKETVTLSNGLELHPGEEVFVHTQSVMSDPTLFHDPDNFDAHRWLRATQCPERLKDMEATFLAFGYGPRLCPGRSLAALEGVAAVIGIVRTFEMRLGCPVEEIKRVDDFIMKANKMPIVLKKRI